MQLNPFITIRVKLPELYGGQQSNVFGISDDGKQLLVKDAKDILTWVPMSGCKVTNIDQPPVSLRIIDVPLIHTR